MKYPALDLPSGVIFTVSIVTSFTAAMAAIVLTTVGPPATIVVLGTVVIITLAAMVIMMPVTITLLPRVIIVSPVHIGLRVVASRWIGFHKVPVVGIIT